MARAPVTRYRVVPQKDLTYEVEVDTRQGMPTTVTSFVTEQEAREWIRDRRAKALQAAARELSETAEAELNRRRRGQ